MQLVVAKLMLTNGLKNSLTLLLKSKILRENSLTSYQLKKKLVKFKLQTEFSKKIKI